MPTYYNPTIKPITLPYPSAIQTHKSVIQPGETIETTLYLLDAEVTALGLQKTSEQPYARISNSLTTVTFASPETKQVSGLIDSRILRIKTNVNILIKPNNASNPYGYHLGAFEGFVDIRNDREIEILYMTSEGAGTAYVIELES